MRSNTAFEQGLAAGSGSGILLLVALYTLYAPTSDLRARIPLLLELGGGLLTLLVLLGFIAVGAVTLLLVARLTKRGLAAVAASSLVHVFVLSSGILPHVIPTFETGISRWAVLALTGFLVLVYLVRRRVSYRAPVRP
jgi:small-conductance mechanosensitive channel